MKKLVGLMMACAFAFVNAATPTSAECTGDEAFAKVKCKHGKLKVKLVGAEAGSTATFQLDGDETTNTEVTVKGNGKAKVKFRGVEEGTHTVAYLECEIMGEAECG